MEPPNQMRFNVIPTTTLLTLFQNTTDRLMWIPVDDTWYKLCSDWHLYKSELQKTIFIVLFVSRNIFD